MKNRPPPEELAKTRPAAYEQGGSHPSTAPPRELGSAPPLYTRAVHDSICNSIKNFQRPQIAAAIAGIPAATYFAWIRMGKEGNPYLWEFAQDVEFALAIAEGKAIETIIPAAEADPENFKWWLERVRADGYSKDAATKANAMIEDFLQRLEVGLPPDIFNMVIAAANGQAVLAEKRVFQLRAVADDAEEETE